MGPPPFERPFNKLQSIFHSRDLLWTGSHRDALHPRMLTCCSGSFFHWSDNGKHVWNWAELWVSTALQVLQLAFTMQPRLTYLSWSGGGWRAAFYWQSRLSKALDKFILNAYQPSNIGKQVCLLSDRLMHAVAYVGRGTIFPGCLYKGSHTILNSAYAEEPHRRKSAIDETVSRYNEIFQDLLIWRKTWKQQTRQKQCKVCAMFHNGEWRSPQAQNYFSRRLELSAHLVKS